MSDDEQTFKFIDSNDAEEIWRIEPKSEGTYEDFTLTHVPTDTVYDADGETGEVTNSD